VNAKSNQLALPLSTSKVGIHVKQHTTQSCA
jgi:hypothetical protein